MPYEPRFYRDGMGKERFASFVINYKDSDLWIGIDKKSYTETIASFALNKLIELRNQLELYIEEQPVFMASLLPLPNDESAPKFIQQMYLAAQKAQTGPMAAVAGTFAEEVAKAVQNNYIVDEIVVENGGDIFLKLKHDLLLSVFAGSSAFTGKIGLEIKASGSPLGVCTSAGTVGHSTSFGKADAVVVACQNAALADALATSIGNKVKTADDIEAQLKTFDQYPEILSLLIIAENKVGIKGKFELKPIK